MSDASAALKSRLKMLQDKLLEEVTDENDKEIVDSLTEQIASLQEQLAGEQTNAGELVGQH